VHFWLLQLRAINYGHFLVQFWSMVSTRSEVFSPFLTNAYFMAEYYISGNRANHFFFGFGTLGNNTTLIFLCWWFVTINLFCALVLVILPKRLVFFLCVFGKRYSLLLISSRYIFSKQSGPNIAFFFSFTYLLVRCW